MQIIFEIMDVADVDIDIQLDICPLSIFTQCIVAILSKHVATSLSAGERLPFQWDCSILATHESSKIP